MTELERVTRNVTILQLDFPGRPAREDWSFRQLTFLPREDPTMAVRFITDRDGAGWQVTQIQPAIVGGKRRSYELSQGWLCFSGEDGRRVRVPRELFAGDWRRISPVELRQMLDTALRAEDPPSV
jgi:hypothetical protein